MTIRDDARRLTEAYQRAFPDDALDCVQITNVVAVALQRLGHQVRVVEGHATSRSIDIVEHAWIEGPEGVIDPQAMVTGHRYTTYAEGPVGFLIPASNVAWEATRILRDTGFGART